jgi:hypothetical protein
LEPRVKVLWRAAICGTPTGTASEITTWSIPMFSIGAVKACVAFWTVSEAALERCLIRICTKPLDKLQIFLYLFEVKVVKDRIMIYSLGSYAAKPALFGFLYGTIYT